MTHSQPSPNATEPDSPTALLPGQGPRLVISWLIVGIPITYGLFQTIQSVLPLFRG